MSGYVELDASPSNTAQDAYDGLMAWFSRYGVVTRWMSDQGSHFRNELVDKLQKALGSHHHFTTAYCPWANGSVEIVKKLLLRCMKTLLSECRLQPTQWVRVLPLVQSALNHQPADRLDGRAPVTAFMALPPANPITTIVHPTTKEAVAVDWVKDQQKKHLDDVAAALDQLHRDVVDSSEKRRRNARARRAQ